MVMKKHDKKNDEVLALCADYVLEFGSSSERSEFEMHMSQCPTCLEEVNTLSALTATLRGPEASGPERPDLWDRVANRLEFTPTLVEDESPVNFQLVGSGSPWLPAPIPGVETRILQIDRERDRVTFEARLEPGSAYPPHEHHGPEECYILSGDLWVGDVHMKAGDYQSLESGSMHEAQSTDGGCQLLLIGSAKNSPLMWMEGA